MPVNGQAAPFGLLSGNQIAQVTSGQWFLVFNNSISLKSGTFKHEMSQCEIRQYNVYGKLLSQYLDKVGLSQIN